MKICSYPPPKQFMRDCRRQAILSDAQSRCARLRAAGHWCANANQNYPNAVSMTFAEALASIKLSSMKAQQIIQERTPAQTSAD